MGIIKGFDMNALRKSRQKAAAKQDNVAAIREISPEIEQLKVGETAVIEGITADNARKMVMSVTAKLRHLTAKGGEWAGKAFDTASDPDSGKLYVQRKSNVPEAEQKEIRVGRGRPKGSGNKPKADGKAAA